MLERLAHRGPDDRGEVDLDAGWLGHTRLSIVDVEGGRQPLINATGDRWLVGNGEIYNHAEVRAGLRVVRSATGSDNEVALALLDERGPDALGELEGMYALVAADETGFFVAARDPVGIKPLYWARHRGEVRFASEMSAFEPGWREHVEAFPPGHHWTPERGLRRFARAVPHVPEAEAVAERRAGQEPGPEALAEIRDGLVAAVRRQLMGDVPVGVFLSGGLDSTLIAAIAARELAGHGERLQTFAVGVEGSPDLVAARRAAAHLGTEHRERIYTARDALDCVERVVQAIEHYDASLVRSAVPNYLLAEMTARHVKVVLTGEGADELFAGYAYLRDLDGPGALHAELLRTVQGLHHLNLQRCDRVTMAHGLEARVPFLDRQVIALALRLPPAWKLCGPGRPEKRILRAAFTGWLPDDLLWREKAEFGDGSGAAGVLTGAMEAAVSPQELRRHTQDAAKPPVRTREELAYQRIFAAHLPGVRPERTLGHFATA